jgi:hypothetical protein
MQKVLHFLERYCQWFAIGLGALFLGFMVWTYFFASTSPLAVSLGGKAVLPGYINVEIDHEATRLEDAMNKSYPGFEIKPPPVLLAWQQENSLADLSTKPLDSPFVYTGPNNNLNRLGPSENSTTAKVKELPAPPAATPVAINTVRTMATPLQPNNGQPANPPAAGTSMDVDVVSVLFTIDHTQLAAAFNKSYGALNNLPTNIQQQINETMVLSVDLMREEQQPDGTWGKDTLIAPLPIHNIMALPAQQNPNANDAAGFLAWAESHTDDILRPSYYPTDKDMPVIYSPDQPPPPTATDQPTPAPTRVPNNPYQRNRPNSPGNTGPGGPGGNGGPRMRPFGGASGRADSAPVFEAQFNPNRPPPGLGQNFRPGMGNGGPGYPSGAQGVNNSPFGGQPQGGIDANVIQGKFDVTKLSTDLRILGHDDTVVPGRTYRYKVRYTLYNSIFGIGNFAQPASLATQFYLASPVSVATGPITIPTRLRFFLASVFKNQVVFDVFTWNKGHWVKSRSKEISPGDAIPGTDWSVLDVRDDLHGNGERYALLINIDGTVERHEVKTDSESPDFEQLEIDTKSAQAGAGTGVPGS